MRNIILLALSLFVVTLLFSQETDKPIGNKGFLIGVNANLIFPGADLSKRFGVAQSVAPYLGYKTSNNWTIGLTGGLLYGNNIKEDSLLKPLETLDGRLIGIDGFFSQVNLFERGYFVKAELGKTFTLNTTNLNSGIMVNAGIGFLQHKIKIVDLDRLLPSLFGDYLKGYDRLSNGLLLSQFIGYSYYGNSNFVNFYAGVEFMQGFTQNRRDYNYNQMRADTEQRLDLMYTIRAGWIIPIFNTVGKSKKYYN